MASRPHNVGILAVDVYFPSAYVSQAELESHDGVGQGKYTIGLGQTNLGFCSDLEDVVSMSLTVVQSLLEKYNVAPDRIGRLEVGSETVIDKSKSIKTSLMQLFEESGNGDIEGVDSTNACYGGTAALQNSLNWVESSAWDGRLALVVAADVAVYAEGAARPTGGAGAVALLIGPNAPLVFERKYTGTHMAHVFDFYKPDPHSEYPVVDGKLSQVCYLGALDLCYQRYAARFEKDEGKQFSLGDADYVVFHSPYNKLVQKSYARLVYNDFLKSASHVTEDVAEKLKPFAGLSHEESLTNRDLEKEAWGVAKSGYNVKVVPSTILPKEIGNMYCASLYAGFASLLHKQSESLEGKRVLLFSYGSGLAATLFSLRVHEGEKPFNVANIASVLDIDEKLKSRIQVTPSEFVKTMHLMETRYGAKDYTPVSEREQLRPGTFYLTQVDAKYRRTYAREPVETEAVVANGGVH